MFTQTKPRALLHFFVQEAYLCIDNGLVEGVSFRVAPGNPELFYKLAQG